MINSPIIKQTKFIFPESQVIAEKSSHSSIISWNSNKNEKHDFMDIKHAESFYTIVKQTIFIQRSNFSFHVGVANKAATDMAQLQLEVHKLRS